MKKRILFISIMMLTLNSIAFAIGAEEPIEEIGTNVIQILSWIAIAIALGMLIALGMKFVLSGANERANLKGKFPLYLMGLALIVMCAFIANGVADIAGNEDENAVIDKAVKVAGASTKSYGKMYKPLKNETPTSDMDVNGDPSLQELGDALKQYGDMEDKLEYAAEHALDIGEELLETVEELNHGGTPDELENLSQEDLDKFKEAEKTDINADEKVPEHVVSYDPNDPDYSILNPYIEGNTGMINAITALRNDVRNGDLSVSPERAEELVNKLRAYYNANSDTSAGNNMGQTLQTDPTISSGSFNAQDFKVKMGTVFESEEALKEAIKQYGADSGINERLLPLYTANLKAELAIDEEITITGPSETTTTETSAEETNPDETAPGETN